MTKIAPMDIDGETTTDTGRDRDVGERPGCSRPRQDGARIGMARSSDAGVDGALPDTHRHGLTR